MYIDQVVYCVWNLPRHFEANLQTSSIITHLFTNRVELYSTSDTLAYMTYYNTTYGYV